MRPLSLLLFSMLLLAGCGHPSTPDEREARRLMAQLRHSKPEKRIEAAKALGEMKCVDAVTDYAVAQTRIVVFSYLFAAWAIVGKAYFQALGRPLPGLVVEAVRLAAVPVPAALVLSYAAGAGARGVWVAIAAGNLAGALALLPWIAAPPGARTASDRTGPP